MTPADRDQGVTENCRPARHPPPPTGLPMGPRPIHDQPPAWAVLMVVVVTWAAAALAVARLLLWR